MQLTELSTLITDFILGAVAIGCAYALARAGVRSTAARLWIGMLVFIGASAFTGGTAHGFRLMLRGASHAFLWKATLLSIGAATFFFGVSAWTVAFRGAVRRTMIALSGLQLLLYAAWILFHADFRYADFRYAVYNYGATMAVVLVVHGMLALRSKAAASRWIVAGIVVSSAAAAVRAAGWGFHEHFTHNDVYHVIQMAGILCFYAAGRRLDDLDTA